MSVPPHLPGDIYIASMLGITPEEYRWFKIQAYKKAKIEPGKPIAGVETLITLSILFSVISIGLAIAASFFKPKERQAGQINVSNEDPKNITRNQRFAPRFGFDSVQDPAVIGSTIPVVYANRTSYGASQNPPRPAGNYGGVRVNAQLILSQMLSIGGDQFLRALFMVAEGTTINVGSIAIGDNTLGAFDYESESAMQEGARYTIYYKPDGGWIKDSDYLAGLLPSYDIGNVSRFSEPNGNPDEIYDVYYVKTKTISLFEKKYTYDSCFTSSPSTGTFFGLTSWLPNGMFYRVTPQITPTGGIEKISRSNGEKFRVDWNDDFNSVANMWKAKYQWSRRCGILSPSGYYPEGSYFTYVIYKDSDVDTVILVNGSNAKGSSGEDADPAEVKCSDIANVVTSGQNSVADSLITGELYKFGSALAVLIDILGGPFVSDSENDPPGNGTSVFYTFRVVRAGTISTGGDGANPSWGNGNVKPPEWKYSEGDSVNDLEDLEIPVVYETVSDRAQGFRCTIGDVRVTRPCEVFEIGFKSTVGIQINGFPNLKDSLNFEEANNRAGGKYIGKTFDSEQNLAIQNYSSGVITMSEERYSFFKVYLKIDDESSYVAVPCLFAIKGNTSKPIYNYLRFEMFGVAEWQIRFEPVSSWELRQNVATGPFLVIDFINGVETSVIYPLFGFTKIVYHGYEVQNNSDTFRLKSIEPKKSRGLGWSDNNTKNSMTDAWGKVAEAFCYDSIQTTVSDSPEHEIVYINTITKNKVKPSFCHLATLGLNIRASSQWSQLSQVSLYVSKGREVSKLLLNDTVGPSNLFPDILRDLLLSTVFGMGDSITEDQIDKQSFIEAAQWCQTRRYFFDGVIAEKVNLRQWAADTAASMLLELLQRDGRFALEPAILFPESGPVPIRGIFTTGNIVENSFSLEFLNEEDREPIQASVKWRQERNRDSYTSPGLFPANREVLVREANASSSNPIESFDISDYCTNFEHAVDFACYLIRVRRLITHSVRFSTTPEGLDAGLSAGDYIKVALDFTFYDEFANGVILENGTVVSTRPDLLTIGTHDAVYWDGQDGPVVEGQITIDENNLGSPSGVIFIKKDVQSQIRTYKIESISLGENGVIDIEAVHHPVDSSGVSEIGKNWTTYQTDLNWVIQNV